MVLINRLSNASYVNLEGWTGTCGAAGATGATGASGGPFNIAGATASTVLGKAFTTPSYAVINAYIAFNEGCGVNGLFLNASYLTK